MEKNYKTISDLRKAIDMGEIKENDLRIILDNDNVSFYSGDEEKDPNNFIDIEVEEAWGYSDIKELYKLVFPKAEVNWC